MEVRNSKQRQEVLDSYRWSLAQTDRGLVEHIPNWDASSPWHNAFFREVATGKQWVVYLADQGWPGEVRLVSSSPVAT
jgi:hypothetical protein